MANQLPTEVNKLVKDFNRIMEWSIRPRTILEGDRDYSALEASSDHMDEITRDLARLGYGLDLNEKTGKWYAFKKDK